MINALNQTQCAIYVDLESLIKKVDVCKSDPESIITKISEHIRCEFSMSMISFNDIENKHDVYRGEDYMKNFVNPSESMQWRQLTFWRRKWYH